MLTDRDIRTAKPKKKDYRLRDGRGLNFRIYPDGRKMCEFQYDAKREKGEKRKQPTCVFGEYGDGPGRLGLAASRSEAQRLRDLRRSGADPREALQPERAQGELTSDVAESWYRLAIADTYRRPEDVRTLLDRHILRQLGAKPYVSLRRSDGFMLVAGIADGSGNEGRKAQRVAAQVLQYLKRLDSYGVSAGLIEANRFEGIRPRDVGITRAARDRNLSFAELAAFVRWLWSPQCFASIMVRALLQILVLTSMRTGEALGAKWAHIDLEADAWYIPPGDAERRAKSARPHVFHLSKQTRAVLASLPRYELANADGTTRASPWVFASPRDPANPIDEKAAARVLRRAFDTDKRKPAKDWQPVTKGRGKRSKLPEVAPLAGIAPFTAHDLRRTFRSRLSDLGVAPHIAEKCLNHELGGVLSVYDRGEYFPERKKALELWGRRVALLLADDKVVEFRAGAQA